MNPPLPRRRSAPGVKTALLACLFAALLVIPVGASRVPAVGAADLIQPFPWGAPPQGFIAFTGEPVDQSGNAIGEPGIFAATRDCASSDCVYRMVTDEFASDPSWDPTGRILHYGTQIGDCEIECQLVAASVDAVTGEVNLPTIIKESTWTPVGSFDGSSVVVTMAQQIPGGEFMPLFALQIGEIEGNAVRRISSAGAGDTCGGAGTQRKAPRLSPVSDQVAYVRNDNCGTGVYIASLADIDATETKVPTPIDWQPTGIEPDFRPGPAGVDWSPDGTRLVIAGNPELGGDCAFILSLSGEAPVALAGSTCAADVRPRWSPDGKVITVGGTLYGPDGQRIRECAEEGRCFAPPISPASTERVPNDARGSPFDVQCTPGNCLTLIRVSKVATDLSAQRYPATFNFTATHSLGQSKASITLTGDPFAQVPRAGLRVSGGQVVVSEVPDAGWRPSKIECGVPGAAADIASGSISLTVEEATITDCTFTNDPGDFVLPSRAPPTVTPTASPIACGGRQISTTFLGYWRAGFNGISSMKFDVTIDWCYGDDVVALRGGAHILQETGYNVFGPFSPVYFKADNSALTYEVKRIGAVGSGAPPGIEVHAKGGFRLCSSLSQIVGFFVPAKKLLGAGFRALPAKVQASIALRLEWAVLEAFKDGVQVSLLESAGHEANKKFFEAIWPYAEELVELVFDTVIGNTGAGEAGEFCGDGLTWAPDAYIKLMSTGDVETLMLGNQRGWDVTGP